MSQMVGVAGLTSLDSLNQTAEFSLYIAPEYQQRGYGKAALKELVKVGFEDWNLYRIWGETFDGNPAAKMFESIGFRKEGTLRGTYYKEGRHINSHIYSITRPDYDAICRNSNFSDQRDLVVSGYSSLGGYLPRGFSEAERRFLSIAGTPK